MLFWLAKAWVLTSKRIILSKILYNRMKIKVKANGALQSHRFSVKNSGDWRQRQITFSEVEASHFPLRKFQGPSHNTEVEYITNGPPGELLTRK